MMRNIMAQSQSDASPADAFEAMPGTLELNPNHHIVKTLAGVVTSNPAVARVAVRQLFDNACIAAGMLEDPRAILGRLNDMVEGRSNVFAETPKHTLNNV